MRDLDFQVRSVQAATQGVSPLLQFQLEITTQPPDASIEAILLHTQIQIQAPQRPYSAQEKERLLELFGSPRDWGRTLRNRLWAHCDISTPPFTGRSAVTLNIPCTFDLNVAATKYLYALEDGDAPLLFLFSGSIFYRDTEDRLQMQRIHWNREATFRMPVKTWREMMDSHYPNRAWFYLDREVFDRLLAFKRKGGFTTWEQAIEALLGDPVKAEALP